MDNSKATATAFLTSLLSKTLRITTSDTRLFVGEFKCTDADRNIILSRTHEYRLPSATVSATPTNTTTSIPAAPEAEAEAEASSPATADEKVVLDMTSRYLGLVVVPGEFISKIEVEEFASQVRAAGGSRYAAAGTRGGEGVV